ncbi:hypothetical protein PLCT2_02377 [Planctomycetaceae bacterium]|nr:hypothetical protein PLCT2_02377 [Planctomycetaceae bacterium]
MKRLIFATLCAAMAFTPALAQKGDDAAKAAAKTKAAAQIKLADKDSDGVLTLAELRTTRYDLRKALIAAREDKAKTKELNEGARGLPEFQVFLASDINNDMKLTADELANHNLSESENKRWRLSDNDFEMLAQETGQDRWEWTIARDTNGDNHLSVEEAGLKSEKERKEFRDADLDKDGLLSSYEFQKFGIDRFKETAKPKVERARAEFKDSAGAADPFALFRKKGRTWMHKTTTTIQGGEPVITYMKYEVTDVRANGATYKSCMLDKDKQLMANMDETNIEFPKEIPDGAPNRVEKWKELGEETLEAAGRKWVCSVWEQDAGNQDQKYWMSVEYPGLIIRKECGNFTEELVAFNDGK